VSTGGRRWWTMAGSDGGLDGRRIRSGGRSIDDRLDASRHHVRRQISAQIDAEHSPPGWIVLVGSLGLTVSTVGLVVGTVVLGR
jgi:hypothetical protein